MSWPSWQIFNGSPASLDLNASLAKGLSGLSITALQAVNSKALTIAVGESVFVGIDQERL